MKPFRPFYLAFGLVVFAMVAVATDREAASSLTEFLESKFPRMLAYIQEVKTGDPEEYDERLEDAQDLWQHYQALDHLKPELGDILLQVRKMEFDARAIAKEVHAATDADMRKKQTDKLRGVLEKQFDLYLSMNKGHIKALEEELKDLKEHLSDEEKNREKNIQEDLNYFLGRDN